MKDRTFKFEPSKGMIGFVYLAHTPLGLYVGQKSYLHKRTLKPLKGYKRKRVKYIPSDWEYYRSSNNYVRENALSFSLVQECKNKNELNIVETYWILHYWIKGYAILNKWCEHKLILTNKEK